MNIQLILEFKISFGKYHSVFPKNHYRAFLGAPCIQNIVILHIKSFNRWFNTEFNFHNSL